MWTSRTEKLADFDELKFHIELDGSRVSYTEVLNRWQHDAEFRSFFIGLLADAPFSAFRWETPSITKPTAERSFEFVLLDSPNLARTPDSSAFAGHVGESSGKDVVEFSNLGNDAIMIVPCPKGPASAYGHLAAFVREAPVEQKHALWKLVGDAMTRRLGPAPVWLSSAGAGVSWLHVRIDDRPKYYGYGPYR